MEPRIGPGAALQALGLSGTVVSGPRGVRRTTRFAEGFARLVQFGRRLAWHVVHGDVDAVVDASSGEVLFRQSLTKHAARADVFRSHPGPLQIEVDLEQEGWLAAGDGVLDGPYAHVYVDAAGDDSPAPADEIARSNGHFEFPFTAFAGSGCSTATQCSWNPAVPASWQTNRARSGVQAFYLVNRFRDHLAEDPDIAFGGFSGGDAVQVETFDGGGFNNASMATPPEGFAPWMELQLFNGGPFRNVHAADSAAIVWHEYAHGLSNRLVVHDDGSGALSSAQAGAMGEGWSDWYALDLLAADGSLLDTTAPGEMDVGHYTDRVAHQLRRQGLDCPVGSTAPQCPGGPGGFTYGDLRGEVHDDGEIWGETLWDLRAAVGSDVAQALITEGMRMSPPEPSFLDMRNAMLAAEAGLPGDHRDAIWQVFARRGMGYLAHTDGPGDLTPTEDFSLPPSAAAARGRTTGTVTSQESGLPVAGVRVGLGGLFGAAAFPDQLATATAANGTYALDAPAGGYPELTFDHAGYDSVSVPAFRVAAGQTQVRDVVLRRDWAAQGGGAAVVRGDDSGALAGCGLARLIDGDRHSTWSAWNPASPHAPDGSRAEAVVRLPQAIDVTGFALDPTAGCGNGAGSATKDFRIDTSADGVSFTTATAGTFGAAHRGRLNELAASAGNVRYVRVVLLSPQAPASDFIDVSELAVYGAPPNRLPSGSLAASRMRLTAGGTVGFAAAFVDEDSRITGYDWDFDGDGTVDRSTAEPAAQFTYRRAGTFAAVVAARDFRGGAGTAARTITVTRPPRPVVRLPRRARRGRAVVRVRCALRCTVVARLQVAGRTVRTVRRTIRTTRERAIVVRVPRRARRARLVVTARYAGGRSTTVRRRL